MNWLDTLPAGQGEPAGTQPSKDRDALGRLLKLQALALKQHLVDGLRAVKQPPRAGKAHLLGRQAEQRDHEPQCGAALVAENRACHRHKAARRPVPLDGHGVGLLGDFCAQLGRRAKRGADVLAVLDIRDMAGVPSANAAHSTARCAALLLGGTVAVPPKRLT